jgi:hypothetical protein
MITLPSELLELIFENLTSKQDRLESQLVCYAWHIPAKRVFYNKVVIQELHDPRILNYNKPYKLKNFIQSVSRVIHLDSRIPSPGLYVQSLHIDFEIVLETQFMPTAWDFQALATACPNLRELLFPDNMFWNALLSVPPCYWQSLKRVSSFQVRNDKQSIERFLYFRTSLTRLHISDWQYRGQGVSFVDMIKSFTCLETLKITTVQRFTSLHDMTPTLISCPNITTLIMICSNASNNDKDYQFTSKLRCLNLLIHTVNSNLLNAITRNFPDLKKLVLRFSQKVEKEIWSDAQIQTAMKHLISLMVCLPEARLELFISHQHMAELVPYFCIHHKPPKITISYHSCSSFTTGLPDIAYHHQGDASQLQLRYQGPLTSRVRPKDLPHMFILKQHGFFINDLTIQEPSYSPHAERQIHCHLSYKEILAKTPCSTAQTLLVDDCPNLQRLDMTHCHVHFTEGIYTQFVSLLTRFKLTHSLLTSSSLYHLSKNFSANLQYLSLSHCRSSETMDRIDLINMPWTGFKKLTMLEAVDEDITEVIITVFEHRSYRTTVLAYQVQKRQLVIQPSAKSYQHNQHSVAQTLNIHCEFMDQFQYNTSSVSLPPCINFE